MYVIPMYIQTQIHINVIDLIYKHLSDRLQNIHSLATCEQYLSVAILYSVYICKMAGKLSMHAC